MRRGKAINAQSDVAVNAATIHCDEVSKGIVTSQITYDDGGRAMFASVDGRQKRRKAASRQRCGARAFLKRSLT